MPYMFYIVVPMVATILFASILPSNTWYTRKENKPKSKYVGVEPLSMSYLLISQASWTLYFSH